MAKTKSSSKRTDGCSRSRRSDALLILVPSHPQRFDSVAHLASDDARDAGG